MRASPLFGKRLRYLPNFITILRFLGMILLLFTEPLTTRFYVIYTLTGFSDLLDGFLARRLHLVSELGAKLDSLADLLLYLTVLLRILGVLTALLPVWFWYGVAVTIVLRLLAYATAAFKYHRFSSTHSRLNKLSSLLLFFSPFLVWTTFFVPYGCVILTVCFLGAVEELAILLLGPAPDRHAVRKPQPRHANLR